MASVSPPLKFRLESGPSEPPKRTVSGAPVKLWLIRAMAEQHELMKRAHERADRLVEATRKIESMPPIGDGENEPGGRT